MEELEDAYLVDHPQRDLEGPTQDGYIRLEKVSRLLSHTNFSSARHFENGTQENNSAAKRHHDIN